MLALFILLLIMLLVTEKMHSTKINDIKTRVSRSSTTYTGVIAKTCAILDDSQKISIKKVKTVKVATSEEAAVEETLPAEKEQIEKPQNFNVPLNAVGINADNFTYMSYTSITNKSTKQYVINYESGAYTDENGCRRITCTWDNDDYYLVAIGQGYGFKAGDYIRIFFEDGTSVKAIIGDMKARADTDETNRYQAFDGSVVELIVEDVLLSKPESFCHGNVISIEELILG